jgi:bacterioferritin-associated ferredoxin
MNANSSRDDCRSCPGRIVCRCLQITEDAVLRVLGDEGVDTLKDLRDHTGAGDGCTACHRLLGSYLARRTELVVAHASSSPSPI